LSPLTTNPLCVAVINDIEQSSSVPGQDCFYIETPFLATKEHDSEVVLGSIVHWPPCSAFASPESKSDD
jgi:hypothetical protein